MSGLRSRLAVFAVVVVLTVSGAAAAGVLIDQGSTERPSVDQPQHQHFQPEQVEPPELERGGEIAFEDDGEHKTILIDVAHANGVSTTELQPVVSALTSEGHTVEYYDQDIDRLGPDERAEELATTLQDVDAFVVVEPGMRYSAAEADVVDEFADADGRVLFAGGPEAGGDAVDLLGALEGAAPADDGEFAAVTSSLGIAYDTGYLYDMDGYETNYRTIPATPETGSDLTDGVDHVVFDGPTPVASDGQSLLTTHDTAEHSESRETDSYSVAVRSDNAVAIGDTGFMTTENHNVGDNEVFIGNLLEFLVTGDKDLDVPEVPSDDDDLEGEQPADPEALPPEAADELEGEEQLPE